MTNSDFKRSKMDKPEPVKKTARSSKYGSCIQCSRCHQIVIVYHFNWDVFDCENCGTMAKDQWLYRGRLARK